ncbi:MAG: aminotransferase class I/II-fold pyridoxal phosphate-dependent enzyme [Chloroflexota bacterium]
MPDQPVSRRAQAVNNAGSARLVLDFFVNTYLKHVHGESGISDFTFGNPHEMPIPALVDALQKWTVPRNQNWFAYKTSEPNAQQVVAESLQRMLGMPFEPDDIVMTNAGLGAIVTTLKLVADPGDEIIYSLPPWFGNEPICIEAGLTPVKVRINLETFDLDLDAIEAAITPRTRVVLVNTPHNPTGKVIPPETLQRLAEILDAASARNGRRIYLLADEPYNRIVFDGIEYHSPLEFYPYSFMAYSYGKTLIAPGQRIGYLAMPPTMPRADREQLRAATTGIQTASGYLFPNALLQHAIGDLEQLRLDVAHLQRKRDHMVDALRKMGYEVHRPEGTFYLFPKSPIRDDRAFTNMLLAENVAVLPGHIFETPGYFRICLTANDEMIECGLPGFRRAIERAASTHPARTASG